MADGNLKKCSALFMCLVLMIGYVSKERCADLKSIVGAPTNAELKGHFFGKHLDTKTLSFLAQWLTNHHTIYRNATQDFKEELLFSLSTCLGIIGVSCIWGAINDRIAQTIYPDYFDFKKGYTAQIYGGLGFVPAGEKSWLNPTRIRRLVWMVERILAGGLCIPVIYAARAGSLPKLNTSDLSLPACAALGFMTVCSAVTGLGTYKLEKKYKLFFNYADTEISESGALPNDEHPQCIGAFFAHNTGSLAA